MTVVHLGPPVGRGGGPAGYLAQLDTAIRLHGASGHAVHVPAPAPAPARSRRADGRWRAWARRARRALLGTPAYYRPDEAEICRRHGGLEVAISQAWGGSRRAIGPMLERALSLRADVIFAHDPPGAEAALERRAAGQQVWLMLHTPMPFALYQAWCWGVPERAWDAVASYPDVRAWTGRELAVVARVDRLFVPCREAAEDLARAEGAYAALLARAEVLMTGAAGPSSTRTPPEARRAFGLPSAEPVGLFLGNAQPYRGLDCLLAAVDCLDEPRRTLPGLVAVAGPAVDRIPFRRRVRAFGPVSEVGDLLAAVDFVINVNRFSLLDLSIIEALEAGRPLLLHATGGNRTFAALGAGAVMLSSLEPGVVAAGLREMFRATSDTRTRLGRQSRACYERWFTLRHLRDRHVALYDGARGAEHSA